MVEFGRLEIPMADSSSAFDQERALRARIARATWTDPRSGYPKRKVVHLTSTAQHLALHLARISAILYGIRCIEEYHPVCPSNGSDLDSSIAVPVFSGSMVQSSCADRNWPLTHHHLLGPWAFVKSRADSKASIMAQHCNAIGRYERWPDSTRSKITILAVA
ncbi:hypothetical protein BDV95DRAFT_600134 [Massariosphaeria phaeospora]|uniref:Uncharacterized protein n=1 Tax=Massariosphaeria phaeospora TaxID=100035 RepID=A0A7C8I5K4_9PLEO|nr:hypothetical protein BDV95DRAFT_600134 [Massariosphaeria phaeospora]